MPESNLIRHTLARNMLGRIEEYERIKSKTSVLFRTVEDFCLYHRFSRQNFLKIYRRYQQNPDVSSLLPQKRGPRYKTRRTDLKIEEEVVLLRKSGNNRYEINAVLKSKYKELAPSPSCIYTLCRKHGLNKLNVSERRERRSIIMERAGELFHIDCHHLPKGITIAPYPKLYLVGLIDGFSRVARVELIEEAKALSVMFATLHGLNMIKHRYGIEAEAVLTDNGAEFGSGVNARNKQDHPFERLLMEMSLQHRYTQPYRPQANGKIERFWKTLNEDFLEEACYENKEDLQKELLEYLIYYNEHRPHQSLEGKTPKEFLNCKRII